MSNIDLGVLIAAFALLITVLARTELRERRLQKLETDMSYARRDIEQLLSMFRLVPVAEQDRRKRAR